MTNRKEYMKKYQQEHKETFRIATQKYRDKNRKQYNEHSNEYRKRKRKEAKENAELVIKYKEVLDKIKEYRKWLDENTVIYNSGECVKLNGTYWEAEGIKIILDKLLEEIE